MPASTAPLSPRPGSHTTRAPRARAQSATSVSSHTTATGSGWAAPTTRSAMARASSERSGCAHGQVQPPFGLIEGLDRNQHSPGPDGERIARWRRPVGEGCHRDSVGGRRLHPPVAGSDRSAVRPPFRPVPWNGRSGAVRVWRCRTMRPPTPSPSEALARVRSLLLDLGCTDAEIDQAVADDVVDLLVVDRMLVPDRPPPHPGRGGRDHRHPHRRGPAVLEGAGLPGRR